MKVRIQLFGVLGKKIPEFASAEGVDIELPDEANVRYLFDYLKIPEEWGVSVAVNGRLLKKNDIIMDGSQVRLIQAVHGG